MLRQLGHDVIAMEGYVAADQRPLDKCLADVGACDLYVGIFAHRYGYVPEDDNPEHRSFIEREYRHAEALGIPRLAFLLDVNRAWPPGQSPRTVPLLLDRARHDRDDLGLVRLAALEALAVLAPTPEAGSVARELRGHPPLKYARERIERLIAVVWPG